MQIIAISGKAASGKDTFADLVKQKLPNVGIIPFAEELKKIACQLWNISPEEMASYDGKSKMRDKLIALGKAVREIDYHTWVDVVIRKIKDSKHDIILIPDARFTNEIYKLLDVFGSSVRLVRMLASRDVRLFRMGEDRAKDYVELDFEIDTSETELDYLEKGKEEKHYHSFTIVNSYNEYPEFCEFINNDFTEIEQLDKQVNDWIFRGKPNIDSEKAKSSFFSKLLF